MSKDIIQEEALQSIRGQKRCGLGIAMGGGKTLIGLRHMGEIYEWGDRFLVVAPRRSIFESWKATAGGFGMTHLLPSIEFTTYLSLNKQPLNYKAIYLDECHSLLYAHEPWLQQYEGIILGLTGTPPRFAASEKGQMVERYCPIAYTYVTDEAVADGILNDYRIVVHHLKLDVNKTVKVVQQKTGRHWYTSEQDSYQYWDKRVESAKQGLLSREIEWLRLQRMRALMGFPSKVAYTQRLLRQTTDKTIVFANTQQQAKEICLHSFHAGNVDSDRNLELFVKGEIRCLSSVAQLNEGVNIPGLKEGILLHAYSNERKTAQRIGRLLRLNPKERATAHILCYEGTVDEYWTQAALQDFDGEKVFHYYPSKQMLYNIYGQPVNNLG